MFSMSPPTSLSPPTSSSPLDDCSVPRRLRTRSDGVDIRQHEKLRFKEKDEARVREDCRRKYMYLRTVLGYKIRTGLRELAPAARELLTLKSRTVHSANDNVLRFWSCTREAQSVWCATPREPSLPSRTPWRTGYAPPSPCTTRSTPNPDSWTSEQGGISIEAWRLPMTFCLSETF